MATGMSEYPDGTPVAVIGLNPVRQNTLTPSVGRIVHYVSHGTPVRADGSQAFTSQCRVAIITEVGPIPAGDMAQAEIEHWDEEARHVVGLCVVNPTGFFFHSIADGGSLYDPNRSGGTWHWPERV